MGITDMIAGFIQEALDDAGGVLEMQRGDLAYSIASVHMAGYNALARRAARSPWIPFITPCPSR